MTNRTTEPKNLLLNEDTDKLDSVHIADLHVAESEADEIKGGPLCHGVTVLAYARVDGVSPQANHNETTVEDDDADTDSGFDDLALTEAQENDIKAGIVFVGGWGASSYQYAYNHNETLAEETDDSETELSQLPDLAVTAEQSAEVKGGLIGLWLPAIQK